MQLKLPATTNAIKATCNRSIPGTSKFSSYKSHRQTKHFSCNISGITMSTIIVFLGSLLCFTTILLVSGLPATSSGTVNIESCSCQHPPRNDCISLPQAILDVQSETIDSFYDNLYSFMTLRDLFHFGLLDYEDVAFLAPSPYGIDVTSTYQQEKAMQRCQGLMSQFVFPQARDRPCAWTYKCTQNLLHFPSFRIEAVLNNEANSANCEEFEVRVEDYRFVKTTCEYNTSLSHWEYCYCGTNVIAFL